MTDKLFAVTSGKGGVGKSTVAAGLAAAFSKKGQTVLLLDLDEGLRCLDLMLGISETVAFDLADVLSGRDAENALYSVPWLPGVSLMPAPSGDIPVDSELFGAFVREALQNFDKVVIDFPAGLPNALYGALPDYTVFLTVCTPDPISLRDSYTVGCRLNEQKKSRVMLVINRFDLAYIKKGVYAGIDDMIDRSALQLSGVIPYDLSIPFEQSCGRLPLKGRAARAFARMADRLDGKSVPLPRPKKI